MVDDLRDHDAMPTLEERAWMDVDIVQCVAKAMVFALIALAIGAAASLVFESPELPASVATVGPR